MGWNTVIEVERATTFLSSLEDRQDLQNTKTTKTQNLINAAGPTSFEDYFRKVHLGQKAALNLSYVDIKPNSQKTVPENLKVCHIWLIKFKKAYV